MKMCDLPTEICNDGDIRLVDGTTAFEGRVEVCVDEEWVAICDNQFDNLDAKVICARLGYSGSGMQQ